MKTVIIVRLGEIALKSKRTKSIFLQKLEQNIKDALERNKIKEYKIWESWGNRIFVIVPEEILNLTATVLSKVFGITSTSPAYNKKIKETQKIYEFAKKLTVEKVIGKRFEVRAKVVRNKNIKEKEIEIELGRILKEAGGIVDLTNPEISVNVEVRDEEVFVFTSRIEGVGGLPVRTEGKGIALFSGGMDSPVATWLAMKRGIEPITLFYNPLGETLKWRVLAVWTSLMKHWGYGFSPTMYIVDGSGISRQIKEKVSDGYRQVVFKRILMRIARELAKSLGINSVITGESIGQVSSQTLHNLYIIEKAVPDVLVIRPLIGFDKEEIMGIARKIGTYEFSSRIKEFCQLTDRFAYTRVNEERIIEEESKVEVDYKSCIDNAEVINFSEELFMEVLENDIRYYNLEDALVVAFSNVKEVVKNAFTIVEDNILFDEIAFNEFLRELRKLGKKQVVVVCESGVFAGELAYRLLNNNISAVGLSIEEFSKISPPLL